MANADGPELWAAWAATPSRWKLTGTHHLDGVGVQGDARAVTEGGQFFDGLEHARLVVAQQDADQAGVRGQ